VLVRTDLPLAAQIVQASHACLEAGSRFPQPPTPSRLVVLAVDSEAALLAAVERGQTRGIHSYVFYEPDGVPGFTAACSEPISGRARRALNRYPLWCGPGAAPPSRGPPTEAKRIGCETT
jgi:hypothetical protein